MKTAALLVLSAALAPLLAALSHGAMRESWAILSIAAAALALMVGGIHYLLGSLL